MSTANKSKSAGRGKYTIRQSKSKQQIERGNPRGRNRTKQAMVIHKISKTMINKRSVRQVNWQYFTMA